MGLTTVPFGILPYTGNNYFFNLNYYAGLEDDADMGIRMITSFRIYDNIKKNICLATLYKQKDCFT